VTNFVESASTPQLQICSVTSYCVKKLKLQTSLVCCLYFDFLNLSVLEAEFLVFSRIFSRISDIQLYFQPYIVVSAKIRRWAWHLCAVKVLYIALTYYYCRQQSRR